jgi:translation initiation factor 3 subunit E
MRNDFFLCVFADKFVDESRALLCELYCTINRRADLGLLASKLELSEEEAEKWMVNMVSSCLAVFAFTLTL